MKTQATPKTIRAFIALPLPEKVTTTLAQVTKTLNAQMPAGVVRWVTPERMHLTLRFLGDTAVSHLPAIAAGLDQVAAHYIPFTLTLDELGCFPNRRRPRVIWVGLVGEKARLPAMKEEIDDRLLPLGWALEDRPFQAHLTLGRVKDGRKLRDVAWGAEVVKMGMTITAVHLIESQLRPQGPVYTVRHTSHFSADP